MDRGANINAEGYYGGTPLHTAIEKENLNLANFLIDKGADVNIKGRYGNTLLRLAFKKNGFDIAELKERMTIRFCTLLSRKIN